MRDFYLGDLTNSYKLNSIFNMDHQMFVRYSQSNGVPQESKLANYMNTQVNDISLRQNFSTKLNLGHPTTPKKGLGHSSEFIPKIASTSSSPLYLPYGATDVNHHLSFANTGEDLDHISAHVTPESSSPPHSANTSLEVLDKSGGIPYQENVGGTTYFYHSSDPPISTDTVVNHTITSECNVYPGTPSHIDTIKLKQDTSFFMSEDIRTDIISRNMLTLLLPDPHHFPDLPQDVDGYHELCPLELISNTSVHKGYQTSMYKATHTKTGTHYCLRRIHGFRLQHTKSMMYVDMWKKLVHSNIVQLKEVFTTKAFGDNSLIFVYDFHPGSETLLNKHFSTDQNDYCDPFANDNTTPRPYSHQKNELLRYQANNKLPEPLIWNYIIQLTSALRIIHSTHLACRSLDPTKIIVTSKSRLRLSCLGVMDVICHDPNNMNPLALIQHCQQEDLTALGKLVLALACKSTTAVQRENISIAMDIVSRSYTSDLRNLIVYLLTTHTRRNVTDIMPMIGARFYTQLDNLQNNVEVLENELSKEMENGRLFRLLSKLTTVNERPELNLDVSWSETGDRYMLKLFRDYVFHQVSEDGHPWLDMAHIIQCLNKLDVGSPEKVCLMSRDEQSILVVSYNELKRCLDQSFDEITQSSLIEEVSRTDDKL
ncbi:hypothetical protein WA026_015767 [Henosepilachna vigintioctopunctata]|uniref:PAN2-PAN3 deadenylation complex subunit PAN3 n=1 Tax=Henosepilachna vigintioctopunctata TaxID=420089 RepID=A0AAW1UZC6_9CUCU